MLVLSLRPAPVIALSLAIQFVACAAQAAPVLDDGGRVAATFRRLDTDGDGKIAGAELAAHAWLPRLDQNGDGAVTLEEAQAVLGQWLQPKPSAAPPGNEAPPRLSRNDSIRQAPERLKPGEWGVGAMIANVRVSDLDGASQSISELAGGKTLLIALVSSSCPVSKRYLPTLARIEKEFASRDVQLLLLAPIVTDSAEDLRAWFAANGIHAKCTRDETGELRRALDARSTTETFVIDSARTLIYRGAIDDQYGLGYSREAPRTEYLRLALEALLASRPPEVAATDAPGCALERSANLSKNDATPTYHRNISRLLQRNCVECHRAGGVAPFPLETFEQVSAKAGMVRRMVERSLMPPWFAAPAENGHSEWANDRSLSAREKAELLAWLDAARPAGDPADGPLPRRWPGEWQIGTPDAIIHLPQPLEVNATGIMPYQYVSVETGFAEEKWVRGFEVQPSARDVVHHVLVFVQEKGQARPRLSEADGFFAAYVPGNNAVIYPDGFAKPLPANSRLLFQIHYTPNGTATRDQTRIGLLFSPAAPRHVIHVAGIADHRLTIPPGADNHLASATIPVPRPVKVLGYMPHMHVRGKAFRYEAIFPDGNIRTLLEVPRYDFNWQLAYRYAEPVSLPAGSYVRAIGWFDNSPNNPANPDPSKLVRWGPQTSDEMMLGYVEYYFDDAS